MITIPTVLIFGAGVSLPFGFPSGVELCNRVIANTRPGNKLLQSHDWDSDDIKSFGDALFYSGRNSVDAFLEHAPKQFTPVGKAAIAQVLIPCEQLDKLFVRENNLYSYLFDQLSTTAKGFARNRLSVLTFNYDRSFEQYMFNALKNSYGIDDDAAAELVGSLQIIHLHGHLGLLPWQKKGEGGRRPYLTTLDELSIREASKGIKIIHEAADNDPGFERARTILFGAKRIIFLGFGYAEANVNRLRIDPDNSTQEIFGSVFRFLPKELTELFTRIERLNESDPQWPNDYAGLDSLAFLRAKIWLQEGDDETF